MTLARWGYLLYGGCVLGDQALAVMTAFRDSYYGLGAQDHGSRFGLRRRCPWNAGTVPGYTASYWAFPEERLAVAVLRNTNGSDAEMTSIVGQLRAASAP